MQSIPDLIAQYAGGADEPRRWIAGLSKDELSAHPVAGTWSIQQVVMHMLDSEMMAIGRMQRVIAEENPLIMAYDETRFAASLGYEQADAVRAAEAFAAIRTLNADTLSRLPEAAFSRTGVHQDRGKVTLREFVEMYAGHVPHHGKFVMEKRRVLGKPLA